MHVYADPDVSQTGQLKNYKTISRLCYVIYHLFLSSFQDIFLNTFARDKSIDVNNFLLPNSVSSTHCLIHNQRAMLILYKGGQKERGRFELWSWA